MKIYNHTNVENLVKIKFITIVMINKINLLTNSLQVS